MNSDYKVGDLIYDANIYDGMNTSMDDLQFYKRWLPKNKDARILELCCGTGRLTLPIAKDGYDILDMCTGSGCIGITLAKKFPDSNVTGVDISDKALAVAWKNKCNLDADNIDFIQSDLFAALGADRRYDIIVSNPPYIPTKVIEGLQDEVRLHDPMLALDGTEDGLMFYRRITDKSGDYLKMNGYLCYEIGAEQAADVSDIMKQAGFKDIVVVKDLAGLDRVVMGRYNKE